MLSAVRTRRRFLRLFVVIFVLTSLAGCGSISERIAGWYVTHKLDDYLDLTREQEHRTRARVDQALVEVRRDTLPAWISLLREARDRMGTPATDAELARLQDRYDQVLDRAIEELVPHIAAVLSELADAQIAYFSGRLRKLLDKSFAEQPLTGDARREKLGELVVADIEELIGDLSDAQARTILAAFHALPDDRPAQYRLNREAVDAFERFLRGHPGPAAVADELRRMWAVRYVELGPTRDRATRLAEQRELMLTISATMTSKQRARGVETLTDHIVSAKRFLVKQSEDTPK